MTKSQIVEILEEIGMLLELKGENPFKLRAYQNGARALEQMEDDLGERIEAGTLGDEPGIGKALVEKIATLYTTGELNYYSDLKESVPAGLLDVLQVPGLGGKKVKVMWEELDITNLPALEQACRAGKVAGLKGFGKKTEEKILSGIENLKAYGQRHLWWDARAVVEPILEGLHGLKDAQRAEVAGSFRRLKETVGDLDFIVASENPKPVMDWFVAMDDVSEVTAHGETKSSVRLTSGMQADLRVVPPGKFAFALHHFTGSKEHNVHMRGRALKRGLSLSEWGLEKTDDAPDGVDSVETVADETELFAKLGLQFIPPELREDAGEIQAAENGGFPKLIEAEDIRGVFHNHTNASDGAHTLEEMVAAADAFGWEYYGVADHSKASFQANGLSEERLEKQIAAIRKLNDSGNFTCHVFAGSEVDILKDGSLDFSDDFMAALDYVVASVHSSFGLSEDDMTKRIIAAIENPHVTMVGHLTGRILLRREPYAVNIGKIVDAAIANNTIIEINAHPSRLDMDWRYWRRATDKGLLTSINPDAHEKAGLQHYVAGVNCARKGWITPESVVNTWPLSKIREFLGSS